MSRPKMPVQFVSNQNPNRRYYKFGESSAYYNALYKSKYQYILSEVIVEREEENSGGTHN